MNRFILRSTAAATADECNITPGRSGYKVTPEQLATFANSVQAASEATRLGIPVIFKDNARNHVEADERPTGAQRIWDTFCRLTISFQCSRLAGTLNCRPCC